MMRNFNIHEIWAFQDPHYKKSNEFAKKWLKDRGYGGLFRSDRNCCCEVNNLRPCKWMPGGESCEAGYRIDCEHGFHVVRESPIVEGT